MLSDSRPDQPPVYLERLELIRNTCKEEALQNLSCTEVSKFVLDLVFVCDKPKILFCQTPKAGIVIIVIPYFYFYSVLPRHSFHT